MNLHLSKGVTYSLLSDAHSLLQPKTCALRTRWSNQYRYIQACHLCMDCKTRSDVSHLIDMCRVDDWLVKHLQTVWKETMCKRSVLPLDGVTNPPIINRFPTMLPWECLWNQGRHPYQSLSSQNQDFRYIASSTNRRPPQRSKLRSRHQNCGRACLVSTRRDRLYIIHYFNILHLE